MEWNGVEWILVEWNGVDGSMECIAVEWNGMESMECIAVEWNGMDAFWVILVILALLGHLLVKKTQNRNVRVLSAQRIRLVNFLFVSDFYFCFAPPPNKT